MQTHSHSPLFASDVSSCVWILGGIGWSVEAWGKMKRLALDIQAKKGGRCLCHRFGALGLFEASPNNAMQRPVVRGIGTEPSFSLAKPCFAEE